MTAPRTHTLALLAVFTLAGNGCDDSELVEDDIPEVAEGLDARNDYVSLEVAEAVEIDVLANDLGLDPSTSTVEVLLDAVAGSTEVTDDNLIRYVPDEAYIGADFMIYRVTSQDGSTSEAHVDVDIECDRCMDGKNLRLSWDANPASDNVIGYRVFSGDSEDPESMEEVSDLSAQSPGFHLETPSVVYDAWYDFRLELFATICFRIKAYNSYGESEFSDPACTQLDDPSVIDVAIYMQ